jgi:hypothetical protein
VVCGGFPYRVVEISEKIFHRPFSVRESRRTFGRRIRIGIRWKQLPVEVQPQGVLFLAEVESHYRAIKKIPKNILEWIILLENEKNFFYLVEQSTNSKGWVDGTKSRKIEFGRH